MNKIKRQANSRAPLPIIIWASLTLMMLLGLPHQAQAQTQWTTATNGTDIYKTTSGNVGIGTTTPVSQLEISGSAPFITLTHANGIADNSEVVYRRGDTLKWGVIHYADAYSIAPLQNALVFYQFTDKDNATVGQPRFIIDNAGNVGIGTGFGAPGAALEINNAVSGDQLRIGNGTGAKYSLGRNTGDGLLEFSGDQASFQGYRFKNYTLDVLTIPRLDRAGQSNTTELIFGRGQGTASLLGGTLRAPDAAGTNIAGANLTLSPGLATGNAATGDLLFLGANAGSSGSAAQSATTRLIVKGGTGNVGIGTTTPTAKLDVNGTVNATGFTVNGTPLGSSQWTTRGNNVSLNSGNVGIGTATPSAKLDVNGNTNVTGNVNVTGSLNASSQGIAEWMPAALSLPAGTVVVLDSKAPNQVTASAQEYDTRVAGVIAEKAGVALGEAGKDKALVATAGIVKVKVDATRASIHVGDLLVTSDREGLAQKSEPLDLWGTPMHRPGTLIGKALEPLENGTGEIMVLLSLR
jgi:hypothetical protein